MSGMATTNDYRLKLATNDVLLSCDGSAFRFLAAVMAQCHVHKDISAGSIEAHHQSFGVFTASAALLGGVMVGGRTWK